MADKTDTANLLELISQIEGLTLRHTAFFQMVKENDSRWAIPLNRYRDANKTTFAKPFDALRSSLQKNQDSSDVIRKLAEMVAKLNDLH